MLVPRQGLGGLSLNPTVTICTFPKLLELIDVPIGFLKTHLESESETKQKIASTRLHYNYYNFFSVQSLTHFNSNFFNTI